MSTDGTESATLPPDDAFSVLGNETRMDIVRTLGDARAPLPFSELNERVGVSDSGQFNYHLDQLTGHFLEQREEGYALTRAGERVVEAILSGAVTEAPVLEPSLVDEVCQFCGGPVGITYEEEQVTVYCTECAGVYGANIGPENHGHLGTFFLPPAGVKDRSPTEVLRAASIWGGLATMAAVSGVCPRCSAPIDESVEVCEDHDPTGGDCGNCHGRYAATVQFDCTNCIYERNGAFGVRLLTHTAFLEFLTAHGINPVIPSSHGAIDVVTNYQEDVVSAEPFEARLTFSANGDTVTFTVADDFSVTDIRHEDQPPG